jgi:hypothetical protein
MVSRSPTPHEELLPTMESPVHGLEWIASADFRWTDYRRDSMFARSNIITCRGRLCFVAA